MTFLASYVRMLATLWYMTQDPGRQGWGEPSWQDQPASAPPEYTMPAQAPEGQPPYNPDYGPPTESGQQFTINPDYGQQAYPQPDYDQSGYAQQPAYGQPDYGQPPYSSPPTQQISGPPGYPPDSGMPAPGYGAMPPAPEKGGNAGLITIIVVVAVLLLCVGGGGSIAAVYFFNRDDAKPTTSPTAQPTNSPTAAPSAGLVALSELSKPTYQIGAETYTRTGEDESKDCGTSVSDSAQAVVQKAGCLQTLSVTVVNETRKCAVTAGILELPSESAAETVSSDVSGGSAGSFIPRRHGVAAEGTRSSTWWFWRKPYKTYVIFASGNWLDGREVADSDPTISACDKDMLGYMEDVLSAR